MLKNLSKCANATTTRTCVAESALIAECPRAPLLLNTPLQWCPQVSACDVLRANYSHRAQNGWIAVLSGFPSFERNVKQTDFSRKATQRLRNITAGERSAEKEMQRCAANTHRVHVGVYIFQLFIFLQSPFN